MSKLVDRQHEFFSKICLVREFAENLGYRVTLGEAERPPEMAEIYAKRGVGIRNSKHGQRLAADMNFYKGGKLVADKVGLESVGLYAESIGLKWGGRFKQYDDSRHFEEK